MCAVRAVKWPWVESFDWSTRCIDTSLYAVALFSEVYSQHASKRIHRLARERARNKTHTCQIGSANCIVIIIIIPMHFQKWTKTRIKCNTNTKTNTFRYLCSLRQSIASVHYFIFILIIIIGSNSTKVNDRTKLCGSWFRVDSIFWLWFAFADERAHNGRFGSTMFSFLFFFQFSTNKYMHFLVYCSFVYLCILLLYIRAETSDSDVI